MAIKRDKKKNCLQSHERIELATPGLRDQWTDHWANEADTLVLIIDNTKKQRRKQKGTVNRDNLTVEINRIAG